MANSTGATSPPTVGPGEASTNQTPNRPMESSLNKVFYSALLFVVVPLVSYVTATLIKIVCPISKTPGSFCCPKYQIGDSGEGNADTDAEKAERDEQRVKNAILLLFTIDVNEEKEEEEELKEIEKAMKRLKEKRLRKMRTVMRLQSYGNRAGGEDNRGVSTAFLPPGEARPVTVDDASERISITEEDVDTNSNPTENTDPAHTEPNQQQSEETTHTHTDPIVVINPNDAVNLKESNCNSLSVDLPTQNLQTVGGSASPSKTEPFENDGPSCPATNSPASIPDATPTQHEKSILTPNPTEITDTSVSSSSNSSKSTVEVNVHKPKRNFSTISSSTVTLIQNHSECMNSIPTNQPPTENSKSKDVVLKDKVESLASKPVTDEMLQKQKDGKSSPRTSSPPAVNSKPVVLNYRATSNNPAPENNPPDNKATSGNETKSKETHQVLASTTANPTKQTVNISKTDHVQTKAKLESVNIGSDDSSVRGSDENISSSTCSNSDVNRIPRGKRKEEASGTTEGRGRNTVPLTAILVQTQDSD